MKRLAFNGGEISPAMALRSDMDAFPRSCTSLLNWEVSPTGGISRRRGMEPFTSALAEPSRLIPFVYASDLTYLVEVSASTIRVLDISGAECARFDSTEDSDWGYDDINLLSYMQLNSMLLLLSPESQVLKLQIDRDLNWTLTPFTFKNPPWHTISSRDHEITISPDNGYYAVSFHEDELEEETDPDPGDILRASYYTERQEAYTPGASLRGGNWTTFEATDSGLSADSSFQPGDKLALATTPEYELFICVADFNATNDFTQGCTSPANYMASDSPRFMRAEDSAGFDTVAAITGLTESTSFKKGDKVKLRSGYWKLFTCIRPFTQTDYVPGKNSPTDYPAHFVYGISVSEHSLTCRGTWKFHCSGTWFGAYEIRRSYTSGELTALWETLGESLSLIGSPTNNLITGNEEEEECYLRLFLTQVRYQGTDIASGWPPDECGNRLVVSAYKHDMHLRVMADGYLQDTTTVKRPLTSSLTTTDWSWCAFNGRYGYPALACLHESRLVLASTTLQPQTIWMSRTDDLNNFAAGSTDNAALHLTMTTQTQASICWLISRGSSIQLGTEDGEWIIQSAGGEAISPGNVRIVNHGRIGSAHIPATSAADRLLYCERGAGRLYQFAYDYAQDAFISQDLTIFADHILTQGGGITGGTIVRKPFCTAVFTLADGTLALMSYNTHHNVNAWHRWKTEGNIESVCALPNGNNQDSLYLITTRNGSRKIEIITPNSPHIDAGRHDYTSEMETTAFSSMETNDRKQHQSIVWFYLQLPVPAASISARSAHATYTPIAYTGTLPSGWNSFCTTSGWQETPIIGIRVCGDTSCEILAAQV